MYQKGLNYYTLYAKRLQLLEDFVLQTPTMFYILAKFNHLIPDIKYLISIFHECGQLNMVSNQACLSFISNVCFK